METTSVYFSEFKSRVCSVKEIAVLYFDQVTPITASRNLRREIQTFAPLHEAMMAAGWTPRKRHLTPRQVELIEQHLGTPLARDV